MLQLRVDTNVGVKLVHGIVIPKWQLLGTCFAHEFLSRSVFASRGGATIDSLTERRSFNSQVCFWATNSMGAMGSSHMCFERRWRRTLPGAHLPSLARIYCSFHPFSDSFRTASNHSVPEYFLPFQSALEQRLQNPQETTKQRDGKNRRETNSS